VAFFVEEFWKVLPPANFFAVGFNLIVLTQRILLKDYLVQFAAFMVVTTTALVVGKAVLIAAAIPMLRWYDRKPPIITIVCTDHHRSRACSTRRACSLRGCLRRSL
jgi:hypothetical protein